jgi:16S rRNA (cytosine967-C5)-methyltransferase
LTPAARLQAAIEILTALEQTAVPADRSIREFFRARRYAGSKDRAAVANRVFDCLRHAYSYAWRMQSPWPRRLVIASLLAEGADPDAFFTGEAYAPAALDAGERQALAASPENPPLNVRGEFPPWLAADLEQAFGDTLPAEMAAMQTRAPVDIRVNTLKTTREKLVDALAAEGFDAAPTPHAATALRLDGAATAKLSASPLFAAGQFDFQDEAAQCAAALCEANPGSRVLDYAAGAGGKALALAAAMANKGEIVAHDIDSGRLAMIGPRASRAGVTIIKPTTVLSARIFDLVLLDAPCSGTGTWRRQPELRVRFKPERLAALVALQSELLDKAAAFVAPGGRLAYATCSVLPCENDAQIAAFLDRTPGFSADPETFFRASPLRTGTDGFFTAILQRRT